MKFLTRLWAVICCTALLAPVCVLPVRAQDTVTGAFEGTVTDSQSGDAIANAQVIITNRATGLSVTKTVSARGRFYQGLLAPGIYLIRVSADGYATREVEQRLFVTRTGEVVPVPVALDPAPPTPATSATPTLARALTVVETDVRAEASALDGQRSGSFPERLADTLPLGGTTITRTFDELALLQPGVALPPPTLGNGAGPGQGAGVGSAGQFTVNGLRSRANNFTVDGADNNDEDIGVRRQGFLSLVPQSIESIREYQTITLLAPAQFGRNLGAQVNAVSKSGGNDFHGTVYGFFNSSQLNARNYFDTALGNAVMPVQAGNQPVITASIVNFDPATSRFVPVNGRPLIVQNQSGGKDSFTFGQGGFVLGGPVLRKRSFFFVSYEHQLINATQEASFAVPTAMQRGAFGSGASGLFTVPYGRDARGNPAPRTVYAFPTAAQGNAVFSLFPYPNNPNGVYGANTLTQVLPADARGNIASGKYDHNFRYRGHQQAFTARYNFTQDRRILPVTGGAIFSALKPRVRTNNLSLFLNSEVRNGAGVQVFNQLRLSYGRTRLDFAEVGDPSGFYRASNRFPNSVFLLNAPLLENVTLPMLSGTGDNVVPNTGPIILVQRGLTTEGMGAGDLGALGPVGQVSIAGFSPIGVDVFNFPQRRVNNTYQLADQLTFRTNRHTFVFGYDGRRSELNSDLPRNFRPIITFNGAPEGRPTVGCMDTDPNTPCSAEYTGRFIQPLTLAASAAPSGVQQVLTGGSDAVLNLRYYQLNFFAQDDWRITPNLSLSLGLRYEYNTPVSSARQRLENDFAAPNLALVPDLQGFVGGRRRAFEADKNNFAPRLAIAYAPRTNRSLVLRAGYGLYYDQIIGAVVSQSRNVFPRFLSVNTAGGLGTLIPEQGFNILNPALNATLVLPGTLNRLNPNVNLAEQLRQLDLIARSGGVLPNASGVEATLPASGLKTPYAHQYSGGADYQLNNNLAFTASYVGTTANSLLRFTTPNLGPNALVTPFLFNVALEGATRFQPRFSGFTLSPGATLVNNGNVVGGRPLPGVGAVNRFETTATSYYHSLQLQLRGRMLRSLSFQTAYTLGRVTDDVSDVFDLAGASALPQNSRTFAGERGPANFDARHRFAYYFVYDVPAQQENAFLRALLRDVQFSGTGQYQSGLPFTVNSIYDVNLDGNLTDRLDTTQGLIFSDDRRQRLILNAPTDSLIANVGRDGSIPRNTFRGSSLLDLNLALSKGVRLSERQRLIVRVEAFNFINRANFGLPVRLLEAVGFGAATNTLTPARRIQFAVKYLF